MTKLKATSTPAGNVAPNIPTNSAAATIVDAVVVGADDKLDTAVGIAIALNNRGIRTARGGQWQVSNVRNLLGRRTEQLAQVAL